MPAIPILPGLSALADRYDGFILDLWGVIHNGQRVFPHAVETLRSIRAAGKAAVLLSNAPRREHVVQARNAEIGLPLELVAGIVTSGEEAWRHLDRRPDDFYRALGRRCLHIGGPRDASMREGLYYDFVESVEQADFILNTGSAREDGGQPAEASLLQSAARRRLPMVCANPDRVVITGERREFCAGALAEAYEALGGSVRWHGKPYPEVYERAQKVLADHLPAFDKSRVLCVGDGMETDMKGAKGAGLAALFVLGGIHGEEIGRIGEGPDPEGLARVAANHGVAPIAALERFVW